MQREFVIRIKRRQRPHKARQLRSRLQLIFNFIPERRMPGQYGQLSNNPQKCALDLIQERKCAIRNPLAEMRGICSLTAASIARSCNTQIATHDCSLRKID